MLEIVHDGELLGQWYDDSAFSAYQEAVAKADETIAEELAVDLVKFMDEWDPWTVRDSDSPVEETVAVLLGDSWPSVTLYLASRMIGAREDMAWEAYELAERVYELNGIDRRG